MGVGVYFRHMSDHRFHIIGGERVHSALARDRFIRGIQTEGWRTTHPDHIVVIHDHQVLAFVNSLQQAVFQLDEAMQHRMQEGQVSLLFIHDDPDHRKVAAKTDLIDVETKIGLIQERLSESDRARVLEDLNATISETDWQKIFFEVVRTGNDVFLHMVEGLPLNINPDDLWVAKKVMHDMQKTFPDGAI